MSRLARIALVPALFAAATANAQSAGYASGQAYPASNYAQYDTARIVSVTPVYGGYASTQPRNCRSDDAYARGYGSDGYYGNNGYRRDDGYYGNDGNYRRDDGYYGDHNGYGYPDNGYSRDTGNGTGRVVAGVVGSVVGAVLGSQMGGGSGRYIGTAIGSAVGGAAGAGVYDNVQRQRAQQRRGHVAVCDMEPTNGYAGDRSTQMYDVTYVYAGRTYTSRMPYRPQGDALRVRVDVQPQ